MSLAGSLFGAILAPDVVCAADLPDNTDATSAATPTDNLSFSAPGLISELRLGGYAHDPFAYEHGGFDLNGEVFFVKPWQAPGLWDDLLPRFDIGASADFGGKTSFAYAGFTWTYDVTKAIFVEGNFGGSINDGDHARAPGRAALGCNWLFHEGLGFGYRLTDHWSVIASLEHMSNAHLCRANNGLTNLGIQVGYTF